MTTTNRKAAILKRGTLLISGLLLLTGCAKESTTTIIKTDSPDKIEYNINQDRFTALEYSQWVIDEQPTLNEMEYFLNNRVTAYEASKIRKAAANGMTPEDYIKANT